MALRGRVAHYLHVAARYLEHPAQLALRRYYFLPEMNVSLGQPWVQALKIATVLDIGANVGDFAFSIRPVLPEAHIYSFEPLPDCHAAMLEHMRDAPRFTAFNIALGDEPGELTFQRNAFAPASSFLKMTETHQRAFPITANNQPIVVKVERLDTFAQQLKLTPPLLVKLDVQGYEGHVLRGGEQTIKQARLMIIETSFERLYEGQPLFGEIFQTLAGWGFAYLGPVHQLNDPRTGQPLQEDSLFLRRERDAAAP